MRSFGNFPCTCKKLPKTPFVLSSLFFSLLSLLVAIRPLPNNCRTTESRLEPGIWPRGTGDSKGEKRRFSQIGSGVVRWRNTTTTSRQHQPALSLILRKQEIKTHEVPGRVIILLCLFFYILSGTRFALRCYLKRK